MAEPTAGELYTVGRHRRPYGVPCGDGWHCRVIGPARVTPGAVNVREIKAVGDRWKDGMSTDVYEAALRQLEVDVDLFGQPIGGAR